MKHPARHAYISLLLLLTFPFSSNARDVRDTALRRTLVGEQRALIKAKDTSMMAKLYSTFVVDPEGRSEEKDIAYMRNFEGRTIRDIVILPANVMDEQSRLWMSRTINALHTVTRDHIIRKDLLFRSGDSFDPVLMNNNRQLIHSRPNISQVEFNVLPAQEDSMIVDIYILTRDKWSIGADLAFRPQGHTTIGIFDRNFIGLGTTLNLSNHINRHNGDYGGLLSQYYVPNMFGSFFSGNFISGQNFELESHGLSLEKEFIREDDYAGGLSFLSARDTVRIYYEDTVVYHRFNNFNVWVGKSINLRRNGPSLYFTFRYFDYNFRERPEVAVNLNPFFHDRRMLMGNIGVYRERFSISRNVYGYGTREYIPYGFNAELLGGHAWEEFGNRWYVGASFRAGGFIRAGYLGYNIALGSYINTDDGCFFRTALVSNIRYFSPLMGKGRYKTRHFVNVNLTRGWNRMNGYRETLGFVDESNLRGLREKRNVNGENRLVMRNETVVFTPWDIYGFKFVMFGFVDMGLIGDYGSFTKNSLYTAVGAGIRIKNERLIFSTITIRLGLAFSGTNFLDADYFYISNREIVSAPDRYIPRMASPIEYR